MAKIYLRAILQKKVVVLLIAIFSFCNVFSQSTIFSSSSTPSIPLYRAGASIEVGVKFRSSQSGYISGIRFYKGAGGGGIHIGHLWSKNGAKLAEATFTGETSSGWQQVFFSTPVAINANTTYVASYLSSAGNISMTYLYFLTATVRGPLRALANGEDGGNGVYTVSNSPAFPTNSLLAANFWVDVIFTPNNAPAGTDITPPTVTSVSPGNLSLNIDAGTTVTAKFSEALNPATINSSTFELRESASNRLVPATVVYDATSKKATLYPASILNDALLYTAKIKGGSSGVKDVTGNAMSGDYGWTFIMIPLVDNTSPIVLSVSPANGATNVALSAPVIVSFSEEMNTSTMNTSRFEWKSASGTSVPFSISYNTSTLKATLTPTVPLAGSTVYNVTVKGGSSGVKDKAGNSMSGNYGWSFTTVENLAPPISIFDSNESPDVELVNDEPAEVGMKFRSSQNGFIKGIRFYKGEGNTGTHIGHLWSSTGQKLGEVTFTNESSSGWQQALFANPVPITAGVTYVASYFSSEGKYSFTNSYFTSAVVNGPLRALADGEDGGNGVYEYSESSIFPTNTFMATSYYTDVLFSAGPDETAPQVTAVSPTNNAINVNVNATVNIAFDEPVNASTINSSTVELRITSNNSLVPATITYNSSTNTASLKPVSALSSSISYSAKVKGGSSGVKDVAGNALAGDYSWTFTTADPPYLSPTEGPGGPILVVSTSSNPFSRYAVEILRAEGLNEFAAADVSTLTSSMLNNYDVIVLGEMTVTSSQVTLLTNWVNAGGTLIAFRPSSLLTPLMGLSAASGTLSDKYLLVNTASGPGAGIVNQTMQFHGAANLHTLSGASSLATLYSSATTATSNPAVTLRQVGSNGGRAVAFTYDLAKSIVYTRQGNPAWAGQKRDGQIDPIRSDDLFYPDWVDFNKIAIPQADEQQRLLANIILQSNLHRKPLPRFWYLPRDLKAAVVMTGDDHGVNGTEGRFNQYKTLGPNTAQDVADWKAVRSTSYVYPGTPLSNAQAMAFEAEGFEIGVHPTTNCANYTPASLANDISTQLGQFTASYPGLSSPATNRTHCLVWSDWSSVPKTELQNGMRFDVNYYYWPQAWMQNRPGMFTGSGLPMRFADMDGSIIDVYQAPTQMTDETNMNYTSFCNAVLDKAIGPEGYYGVFTANMHTDQSTSAGSDAIVASAQARQVPVVSAKQMLNWLDGRNNSSFTNMTWSSNKLTMTITATSNARNLKAMLPLYAESGQLVSITRSGSAVPFTTQTIKGMQYAFFAPVSGSAVYVATYGSAARSVNPEPGDSTIIAPEDLIVATEPVPEARTIQPETNDKAAPLIPLYVNVMPNPGSSYFNLVISSNDANPVTVRVTDLFGRVIETHEKVVSTGILRIGYTWAGGTYLAEVIQGDQKKVMKLIKVN